jgi:hypothetical protein
MEGRTKRQLVLALALAACGPVAAQAQMNPLKGEIGMSEEELTAMGAAAAKLYSDPATAPGSVERWQAPSGTAGTVRLAETYEFEGMPCARLLHEVKRTGAADPQTFTIDRCRTAEGDWKIR